ncbi:hypothetical protein [Prosthecobacter sp.]|uniref:hypothetical protein n=1 Tax=Prosthecobacter sp. TaxID=1965333 RepID=UPI002AB8C33B|nr:hypothetical protein [Prosthecobacter sp.]MDZ4403618.1 hypothetical protein [Prosthecobacter sp.]
MTVVAIHNGFYADIRVHETLEWLNDSLGSDLRICSASWNYGVLERQLDLRAVSIRAAAEADVILVAATEPLPNHIERWLDASLREQPQHHRAALIALDDDDDNDAGDGSANLCSSLKQLACRWQTEFMCNHDLDQHLNHDCALRLLRRKGEGMQSWRQPFGSDFYSAPACWGING